MTGQAMEQPKLTAMGGLSSDHRFRAGVEPSSTLASWASQPIAKTLGGFGA